MEATTKIINEYTEAVAEKYKELLKRDGKLASGNLYNSVRVINDEYAPSISLADYWQFVESGRRPGKFPPPPAIKQWVQLKFPNENNLKIQQLTYLIGRKIAEKGIKPGNQMQEAINAVWPQYANRINESIKKDLF